MAISDLIGCVGVTLLLLGFFLNVFGFIERDAPPYHLLNAVGAALSGYASYLIGFVPFVVLEGTWAAVAVAALLRFPRRAA